MNEIIVTYGNIEKADAFIDRIATMFYPNDKASIKTNYVLLDGENTKHDIGIAIRFAKDGRICSHYNVLPYEYLDMDLDFANTKINTIKPSGELSWSPSIGRCRMFDMTKSEIPGNAQGNMVWVFANEKISVEFNNDIIFCRSNELLQDDVTLTIMSIPFCKKDKKSDFGKPDLKENVIHDVTIQWHEEYRDSVTDTNIGKVAKSVFKTLDKIGSDCKKIIVFDWIEPDYRRVARDMYTYTAELALKVFTSINPKFKDCIFIAETYASDTCKDYDKAVAKQAMFLEDIGFRNINSMYKSDSRIFLYKNKDGFADNLIYEIVHNEVVGKNNNL